MVRIGTRIKAARKLRHLTQKDIADHVGVSVQAVSKWERIDNDPDITLLCEIADILEVTLDYLLGRKDNLNEIDGVTLNISKDEVLYMIQDMDVALKGMHEEPFTILKGIQKGRQVPIYMVQDERKR